MSEIIDKSKMTEHISHYVISEELLGRGTFGIVNAATDTRTGQNLAVKIYELGRLSEQQQRLLCNEERLWPRVHSPYVVQLVESVRTDKKCYFFMERCGENLMSLSKRIGAIEEPLVRKWTMQLVTALHTTRECNIVHRDLKPANILLTSSDYKAADVKLCDWGLCRCAFDFGLLSTFLGSPQYCAPEVLKGQLYDYKVDVWSLGAVVYSMLLGVPPFAAKTEVGLYALQKKIGVAFPANVDISPRAKGFVFCAMKFDPRQRPSFNDLSKHPFLRELPEIDLCQGKIQISEADFNIAEHLTELSQFAQSYVEQGPKPFARLLLKKYEDLLRAEILRGEKAIEHFAALLERHKTKLQQVNCQLSSLSCEDASQAELRTRSEKLMTYALASCDQPNTSWLLEAAILLAIEQERSPNSKWVRGRLLLCSQLMRLLATE